MRPFPARFLLRACAPRVRSRALAYRRRQTISHRSVVARMIRRVAQADALVLEVGRARAMRPRGQQPVQEGGHASSRAVPGRSSLRPRCANSVSTTSRLRSLWQLGWPARASLQRDPGRRRATRMPPSLSTSSLRGYAGPSRRPPAQTPAGENPTPPRVRCTRRPEAVVLYRYVCSRCVRTLLPVSRDHQPIHLGHGWWGSIPSTPRIRAPALAGHAIVVSKLWRRDVRQPLKRISCISFELRLIKAISVVIHSNQTPHQIVNIWSERTHDTAAKAQRRQGGTCRTLLRGRWRHKDLDHSGAKSGSFRPARPPRQCRAVRLSTTASRLTGPHHEHDTS